MNSNEIFYELLRKLNPLLPPYDVFDKYKDDIEGLAAFMIKEHPDKKEDIEKIVRQLNNK
jgi:hypothetical protein